jgi:nitrite reductase/ring-hydroxylating ferredoxin subunit
MTQEAPSALRVCAADELQEGRAKVFKYPGGEGIVVRAGGAIYACQRYCTHERFPLEFGVIKDGCKLRCTNHHAEFDLRNGEVLEAPEGEWTGPIAVYNVRVEGGDVMVELPAPGDSA